MYVVATAGHVDHGKSTLVRALTGQEPDRWAEERRRGMTIDLGYAWTDLPSGRTLAFVDVPGHERFIGNMIAGLGPAPAVLVVVAADEGWRQQSAEHLAAVNALGLRHGLLAVTRSDLADPGPAMRQALAEISGSSLGDVEAVAVSGATRSGLDELRAALDRLVSRLPTPRVDGRVRLWVDRSFTIRGSGTVVTGTLGAGTIRIGDELEVSGERVRVRGLQSLGRPREEVSAVARVAVNLRAVAREDVIRGDAVLTPGRWRPTTTTDVRLLGWGRGGRLGGDNSRSSATFYPEQDGGKTPDRVAGAGELPAELVLHVGTAAVAVHVRPLGRDHARLTLRTALPLEPGDRAILRDPGRQRIAAGVLVLDTDPPAFDRRGAAARRTVELASTDRPDPTRKVARRGAVRRDELVTLGTIDAEAVAPQGVRVEGDWWIDAELWHTWEHAIGAAVDRQAASQLLEPTVPTEQLRRAVGVPHPDLMPALVAASGLVTEGGRVGRPGSRSDLGPAEAGLRELEIRLTATPFAAPERPELDAWGLGLRQLAAAEREGRIVRLPDDVVLLPSGPPRAMRVLAGLSQPFTTSEARQALETTRRVAIPLLEHLDRRGWTRRIDGGHREVVR